MDEKKPMGKARAGRREQRQVKRAVVKAARTTKYANQKGGGGIAKSHKAWRGGRAGAGASADEEAPMAVIRDGKAVWMDANGSLHADAPGARAAARDEESQENDGKRFSSAEKKLRALRKKLRRVQELRARRRRGVELDGAQQELLRGEAALREAIERFESESAGASGVAEEEEDVEAADGADDGSDGVGEAPAEAHGSRLQQRRALKKQRHLARNAKKQRQLRKKRPRDA